MGGEGALRYPEPKILTNTDNGTFIKSNSYMREIKNNFY
jgi:hypothetical protein